MPLCKDIDYHLVDNIDFSEHKKEYLEKRPFTKYIVVNIIIGKINANMLYLFIFFI